MFFILFCLLTTCSKQDIKQENSIHDKTIFILPLGKVDAHYINIVAKSVEKFYGYTCIIKKGIDLSPDLLAKSKTRYEASKILAKFKSKENVLIITEKDIAYFNKEKNISEYGILGLGLRPGKTAVISVFRMNRKATKKLIYSRLEKVSIHEIGHNLGLDHCAKHPKCLMNAAHGSIKQVDRESVWFCGSCKKQLN